MSRLEKNAQVEQGLERMKGEVIQAVRKARGPGAMIWLFPLGVLALLICAGALWAGIATGVITVPSALVQWMETQRSL